jgi:uncharacterized membrane protein YvlD (DUF360 family)
MCRPSCRPPKDSGGGIITVIALAVIAAIILGKIAPVIGSVTRVLLEIVKIGALSVSSTVILAAITWTAARITRHARKRRTIQSAKPAPVIYTEVAKPAQSAGCLACGGYGRVLRAANDGVFQPRACPECQPERLAG